MVCGDAKTHGGAASASRRVVRDDGNGLRILIGRQVEAHAGIAGRRGVEVRLCWVEPRAEQDLASAL